MIFFYVTKKKNGKRTKKLFVFQFENDYIVYQIEIRRHKMQYQIEKSIIPGSSSEQREARGRGRDRGQNRKAPRCMYVCMLYV